MRQSTMTAQFRGRAGRGFACTFWIVLWAAGCGAEGSDQYEEVSGAAQALRKVGVSMDHAAPTVTRAEVQVMSDRPAATLTADGRSLGVWLEGAAATGSRALGSTMIYQNALSAGAAAVRNADGAVQFLTVLDGPAAASTQRYRFGLPEGAALQPSDDGGFLIVDPTETIGKVAPPWAKDASGRFLPTTLSLEGSALVQQTDTTGADFPIVVDPRISFGWYIYVRFSPSERREIWLAVSQAGGAAAGGLLCAKGGPFAIVCGAVGAGVATVVFQFVYDRFFSPHCGMELRVRYTGSIAGHRLIRGDSASNC